MCDVLEARTKVGGFTAMTGCGPRHRHPLPFALGEKGEPRDADAVKLALGMEGIDVNETNESWGRTVLWSLCDMGKSRNVELLLADPRVDPTIRQSSFLSTINRMLGAKIGRNVKFDSVLFPEADLYEFGDNCWIGLYGIYCHDFFQRHLIFKPVICERGCRIDTGQVVPGTHLGPGTRVGPASLCLPGHYPGPCDSLQGLPATYVRRGGNGEWIPEDDDTIQEMAAPWLRRDEGALGRDGLVALLRRSPRVERLQIPRRGGGKGKRGYGKNKELATPLLAGNEATDAMHDFV